MILVEGTIEDEAERLKALAALAEVSLVKNDPFENGTLAVTVHRLVQAVARARSEDNGSAQDAVTHLIARLVAVYPDEGGPKTLWTRLTFRPHVPFLPRVLARYNLSYPLRELLDRPAQAKDLDALATMLQWDGDLALARPFHERALAIGEKALGAEHPDTNHARCHLARLRLITSHPTEALALGETALAAHDKVLGRDHPYTEESARVTVDALDALGRKKEAARLRKRYGLPPSFNKVEKIQDAGFLFLISLAPALILADFVSTGWWGHKLNWARALAMTLLCVCLALLAVTGIVRMVIRLYLPDLLEWVSPTELIVQLAVLAIGLALGAYVVWWT
jgi:hypothetical protein